MSSNSHDDLLFFIILLVGFHALMHLGELVWPDKKDLQDFWKVTTQDSVELLPIGFSFFLPGHKADKFFKGNRVIVQQLILAPMAQLQPDIKNSTLFTSHQVTSSTQPTKGMG